MFKKSKKLAYQVHVEACLVDIVGLGAQNWDPSPGVGVEEGVHEILETYPLDGHSQVEAAGLVDMHPGMKKSTDSIFVLQCLAFYLHSFRSIFGQAKYLKA